jgi:hypothetical protein
MQMKNYMRFIVGLSLLAVSGLGLRAEVTQTQAGPLSPAGRWRIKFDLSGVGEKNLIFQAEANGAGSVLLLDAAPDNKPAAAPVPASWSPASNDRLGVSSEVELPIGTCCREVGTLVLKGKQTSKNSISGKAIFIGATEDDENFNGFRSMVGSFTATRMTDK